MGLRKRANRTAEPTSGTRNSRAHAGSGSDSGVDSAAPRSGALTHRGEKILLMLAVQSQQLDDRLTRLENRVETVLRDSAAQPDQQDLLELRLNSARLAAEVSRLAIELRSEIKALGNQAEMIDLTSLDDNDDDDPSTKTKAVAASDSHPSAGTPPHRRVDDVVYDLRDHEPKPRPRPTSGWKPIRTTKPPDSAI